MGQVAGKVLRDPRSSARASTYPRPMAEGLQEVPEAARVAWIENATQIT